MRSSKLRDVSALQAIENSPNIEKLADLLPPLRTADEPAKKGRKDLVPSARRKTRFCAERELQKSGWNERGSPGLQRRERITSLGRGFAFSRPIGEMLAREIRRTSEKSMRPPRSCGIGT